MDTENEPEQIYNNTQKEEKTELTELISKWLKQPFTLSDFPELVEKVNSDDLLSQHYGIIGFRKLLSIEGDPPIDIVIQANLIPRFISFLERDDQPHLQMEAAWALTNVASGKSEHVAFVVNYGIVSQFLRLFASNRTEIVEQVIWGLGNIAGDSSAFRDFILQQGGCKILIDYLMKESGSEVSIKRVGAWALSNFCRGKPVPLFEFIKDVIPFFCAVIRQEFDEEVLNDSLWGLSYLSDSNHDENLVPMDIIPVLMKYLENADSFRLITPCLRIIGNFTLGTQSKALIQIPGLIPLLFKVINEQKKSTVRREACWAISNLAAGSPEEIEVVFEDPFHILLLAEIGQTDKEDVKKEIMITFSNALNHCSSDMAIKFVKNGVLDCMTNLLVSVNPILVLSVLEGMRSLLDQGKKIEEKMGENPFIALIEEKGALQKIEDLQTHKNEQIYQASAEILEGFFNKEKNDD